MAKHRFSRFVELSVTYPWECSDQDDTTIREWPLIDDIISWAFQQHVGKKERQEGTFSYKYGFQRISTLD